MWNLLSKIDSMLDQNDIPWVNCVGFGVDNTSVNVGKHYSIKTHVLEENSACYLRDVLVTSYTTLHVMSLSPCKRPQNLMSKICVLRILLV